MRGMIFFVAGLAMIFLASAVQTFGTNWLGQVCPYPGPCFRPKWLAFGIALTPPLFDLNHLIGASVGSMPTLTACHTVRRSIALVVNICPWDIAGGEYRRVRHHHTRNTSVS
jgi:hypothetical protein